MPLELFGQPIKVLFRKKIIHQRLSILWSCVFQKTTKSAKFIKCYFYWLWFEFKCETINLFYLQSTVKTVEYVVRSCPRRLRNPLGVSVLPFFDLKLSIFWLLNQTRRALIITSSRDALPYNGFSKYAIKSSKLLRADFGVYKRF